MGRSEPGANPSRSLFLRAPLWAGLLGLLAGLILLIFGIGEGLRHLSYDIPFAFRSPVALDDVVIVYMDEESTTALGQSRFDGVWDRQLHAQLIRTLQNYGVKAIAFDVLFDDTNHPVTDAALVAAVRQQGHVAVAGKIGPIVVNHELVGLEPVRPFPALRDAVAAWGIVEVSDSEATVRMHYTGGMNIPSMNQQVAELSTGGKFDPTVSRWMNYYGPPGTVQWESYHRVLSNAVPQGMLSNKVVYVGALFNVGFTGGKGTDDFKTPYTRWDPEHKKSPGVEINATACLNLIRHEWLERLPPWIEVMVVALMTVAVTWLLSARSPAVMVGLSVGSILLLSVAGCWLPFRGGIWFPWLIPVLVQIPLIGSVLLLAQLQTIFLRHRSSPATVASPLQTILMPNANYRGEGSTAATVVQSTQSVSANVRDRLRDHLREGQPSPEPPPAGTTVETPWIPDHQMLRRVAGGSYGEIWLARSVLGGYRAVKVIYKRTFNDARPYEREFEGIRNFDPISRRHPGLVHVLHVGRMDAEGYFYYLMELADDASGNKPLSVNDYVPLTLSKRIFGQRRPDLPEVLRIAEALADALVYLHSQGLMHRDIKSSNIIFVEGHPKLADIGLVTEIGVERTLLGTFGYIPPEGPGTSSADIYSLGMVIYELATGMHCTKFPELPSLAPEQEVHPAWPLLNDVFLKACHTDPKKRFGTASDLLEALQKLAKAKPSLWKRLGGA